MMGMVSTGEKAGEQVPDLLVLSPSEWPLSATVSRLILSFSPNGSIMGLDESKPMK